MAEYKIGKRARVCCVSGSTFAPGDAIVSAIYVAPDGAFERRDMRDTHFDPAAEEPFCHWRSIEPDPDEPGRKLDYDLAMSFFDRLLNEANPTREGLLYTLTLLLSRKRRVRIQESRRLPEGDLLPFAKDNNAAAHFAQPICRPGHVRFIRTHNNHVVAIVSDCAADSAGHV